MEFLTLVAGLPVIQIKRQRAGDFSVIGMGRAILVPSSIKTGIAEGRFAPTSQSAFYEYAEVFLLLHRNAHEQNYAAE
jgi:hypothetical protein